LPEHIGGKAGKRNAKYKGVEFSQRFKTVEAALMEENGHHVRSQQGRNHCARNDAPRFGLADQSDSEVGRQKNEGETKSPPSAMKPEQIDGYLHQIIAGDNNEDVESDQQAEIKRHPRMRERYGSHA